MTRVQHAKVLSAGGSGRGGSPVGAGAARGAEAEEEEGAAEEEEGPSFPPPAAAGGFPLPRPRF